MNQSDKTMERELIELFDASFWIFLKGVDKLKQEGKGDYSVTAQRIRQRIDDCLREGETS